MLGSGMLVKLLFAAWWTLVAVLVGAFVVYYLARGLEPPADSSGGPSRRASGRAIDPERRRREALHLRAGPSRGDV
jgi:hypothetical protein